MEKSTRNIFAFSLAEALITLLIVAIITLATIPVITKKHRNKLNTKHGYFACYWVNGNLISRYKENGNITSGEVKYDDENERYGCVFNPPAGARNYVVTVVGGGGGGASGYAEDKYQAYTDGESGVFNTPVSTEYQFLVAGAGGAGGQNEDNCHNTKKGFPCGVTATPGAVLVTEPTYFAKGSKFTVVTGKGGEPAGPSKAGTCGGDSYVTYNNNYMLFAQGGGGGSAHEKAEKCSYYQNSFNRNNSIYNRKRLMPGDTYTSCREKSTAQGRMTTGKPGGYEYKGFKLARYRVETSMPMWYEVEKNGAYLLDDQWKITSYGYAQREACNRSRPYRNSIMNKSLMSEFNIDSLENQLTPFASGSSGDIDSGTSCGNNFVRTGGPGVVAIKWHESYGALGGSAGRTLQQSFAELPQGTMVFPGRGGKGGYAIPYKNLLDQNYYVKSYDATRGEDSYVMNYPHALGGEAALSIDPARSFTYYVQSGVEGTSGQDGELAGVSPKKNNTKGGAGGMSKISQNGYIDNNNLYGLTREVFKNNQVISSFNNIVGAGAGGGGGTAPAKFVLTGSSHSQNQNAVQQYIDSNIGKGGDGSSGIVFIQW